MIIDKARVISAPDPAKYAWAALRRFHNVTFVADTLEHLHQTPKDQKDNVRKQAQQVRHCLIQAREYFDAASAVSLATKPLLLYYSIMSLALAEILFKGDGTSSLDMARDEHKHHGLEFHIKRAPKPNEDLITAAEALFSTPARKGDQGFGTFELWHRTCRDVPLVGPSQSHQAGGYTESTELVFRALDERLIPLPGNGISLAECFKAVPGMLQFLAGYGVLSDVVRGRVNVIREVEVSRMHTMLTIHPSAASTVAQFMDNIIAHPSAVYRMNVSELRSGFAVSWTSDERDGPLDVILPSGTNWTLDQVRFWPNHRPLNEFGYFYVGLHILGNYVRYYPDKWMLDVEQSSALLLGSEEFVSQVERRMALLTLSELTQTSLILDS